MTATLKGKLSDAAAARLLSRSAPTSVLGPDIAAEGPRFDLALTTQVFELAKLPSHSDAAGALGRFRETLIIQRRGWESAFLPQPDRCHALGFDGSVGLPSILLT